jgi:hypothetical protein
MSSTKEKPDTPFEECRTYARYSSLGLLLSALLTRLAWLLLLLAGLLSTTALLAGILLTGVVPALLLAGVLILLAGLIRLILVSHFKYLTVVQIRLTVRNY